MVINLKISEEATKFEQFTQHFNLQPEGHYVEVPAALGKGFLRYRGLPHRIQLHHFKYKITFPLEIHAQNNLEDGLYIVVINLSHRIIAKNIGGIPRKLSTGGKCGVAFHSPGYISMGSSDMEEDYELVFFSFPVFTIKSILQAHPISDFLDQGRFYMYTELSDEMERSLRQALRLEEYDNGFIADGTLLQIFGQIISSFSNREYLPSANLNLQDIERQFKVKEILLSHIFGTLPKLDTLAEMVHISTSKLKSDFKSLFGNSIYQYYLAQKMEVAKELIAKREGTISEIGHRLGYSNAAQFSSQFKKHFGTSPSQLFS